MRAEQAEQADTVCPARAGMIRVAMMLTQTAGGLPRTRGDDPVESHRNLDTTKFAPHARG